MLTIDVDFEEEINKNDKLTLLADRINNKKRTEYTPDCKYNKNKGEIIGKGQFGTIYEFVETKRQRIDKENETENKRKLENNENKRKTKYVIKDSNTYAKVNKIKKTEDLVDQQLKLLDYHDNEITNIINYSKITQMYYPNNFVKCFDTDHGALYSPENIDFASNDTHDDDFLINQIVLERVFGEILCKYDNLNDIDDLELIFIQLVFITINMNMIGVFHNDIKSTNIMIEKTNVLEVELSLIKGIEKILNTNIKINLKSKKSYFPLVKFVDYSFSYVNTENERTENILIKNERRENIEYFLPIEIFHIINMFNVMKFTRIERLNKLKKFRDELFGDKILNFNLPRITKDNIYNYEEVDPALEEDTNKLKLEKMSIPTIKEYLESLIIQE